MDLKFAIFDEGLHVIHPKWKLPVKCPTRKFGPEMESHLAMTIHLQNPLSLDKKGPELSGDVS